MVFRKILPTLRSIAVPPPASRDELKRREGAITFLVLVLLLASTILVTSIVIRRNYPDLISVLIADFFLLAFLLLARRGNVIFACHFIPLVLNTTATYIAFRGAGIHDITLLSFPMIVAIGGLLQGKHGSIWAAFQGTICFIIIYWGEVHGLIPGAIQFRSQTTPDDLIVMAILLWITAAFMYFATNYMSKSLASIQLADQALRQANDDLGRYTSILEQRSRQLLTGAQVSRAASTILEPDELCQQVVDLVGSRFGLYFVSLYLVDEKNEWAILHAGTGEAGKVLLQKGHHLSIGNTSMIGGCIASQKARIALDVGKEAVRFDNPILPETRSELALPLSSRGDVIGALGIQSKSESAFSDEDIAIFQAMADQLANAISNARLYRQLQRELSEKKRVEAKIRQLNKELEKRVAERTQELQTANKNLTTLSHLKDEFLANVSHELRTPLTSIKLYHNLLEKHPNDPEKYIRHLKRETDRLARLIEDLLYFSRLEQGYSPFHPESLDLNRLAKEYYTDRLQLANERQLSLAFEEALSLPCAFADEQMTGQVISVLLTNAMNYTPAGGKITIRTLTTKRDGQSWAGFSISDTGLGITNEDLDHLFERFYRGKAGRTSSTPGTGLGLSIAKEIIQQHNGKIEVQSEGIEGKGTTFFVWLPIAST